MRWGIVVAAVAGVGCQTPRFPTVPGQTDIVVTAVTIEPRAGEHLEAHYKELYENLGLRKHSAIRPGRKFNPFRLAEDRRRIVAFLQGEGHFDAEVDEPALTYSADHKSVAVAWHVHEGTAYVIGSVELIGAPPEHAAMLRAMIPFAPGDPIALEKYRPLRRTLAERLQDEGYGHARGYSRIFVDKDKKSVAWFYYLDPGPQTSIGTLVVEGNHKVPADAILARTGLGVAGKYSTTEKRRAELALLDTGAFASAVVLTDADIQTGPPEHPDTGGLLAPDQVDPDGKLVPRQLPDKLAVRVVVVEAPARQLRAELGVEGDPTRIDAFAGSRVTLRNLFGPQHHLVLEGNVGYGWLVGDEQEPAEGLYGSALAQYVHPGWIHRNLDLRITTRWRDILLPSALLREIVAGPGVRTTLARNVFFDLDVFYRFGRQLDLPAISAMDAARLAFPAGDDSQGPVLEAAVIADRRDDRVEPTAGWLLGVRSSFSPGGALADHRWLQVVTDARAFHPLGGPWSVGVRGLAGWVLLPGDDGVPLGPRLFGGGAHGFRGLGRDRLSPAVCPEMMTGECDVLVGGRSIVESSVELRMLPFRKLYGAAVFVDAGAVGAGTNAFEDGVSLALGLGARIRSWYLPVALDFSYRLVESGDVGADFDRLLVFVRIGEAF